MPTRSRIRALAVTLVGVLTAALLTLGIPVTATAAGTASISGKVTVPAGVTIPEYTLYVDIWDSEAGRGDFVPVAPDGTYSAVDLDAGSYTVRFYGSSLNLVDQWWKNATSSSTATKVALSAGQAVTGIDATLVKGATVSGKVTLPSGTTAKPGDVSVAVYSGSEYTYVGGAQVGTDGTYTVKGLPAGSVKVSFSAWGKGLLEQWWKNQPTWDKATKFSLTAGGSKTGVDATLVRSATISGKVTLPKGITRTKDTALGVTVYNASKETYVTGTSVSASGTYSLDNLPAGTYKVNFYVYGVNALPQWWKGKTTWASATKITVKAGQKVSGVNAALQKGAKISGKVVLPKGSNTKLSEIAVDVYRADKRQHVGYARVSSKGTYSIDQLPAGSYKVAFTPNGGKASVQWWSGKSDWKSATKITLRSGAAKSGVNASLKLGGAITGTVTGSAGKKDGAIIQAYRLASDGEWEYAGWARTTTGGKYKVEGLATGKYAVQFYRTGSMGGGGTATIDRAAGEVPQLAPTTVTAPAAQATSTVLEKWWKDKPDAESANRVSVTAKKATNGINTNLDKKPAIQKLKTATPKISGTAKVGKKLTATAGTWTKYATLTYQWYANGKAISKATKSTFTLTKAQKGKTITVKVTGTKTGYSKAVKTSKATAKVS